MPALGYSILLATFVVCSYAAGISVAGARRGSRAMVESGIGAFYLVTALMTVASTIIVHAFVTNDYYASDVAWMELDASIDPTIGPYESYEDEWFNAKAGFEAFVTLRDAAETQKLARFGSELQELENNLPVAPRYRPAITGRRRPAASSA